MSKVIGELSFEAMCAELQRDTQKKGIAGFSIRQICDATGKTKESVAEMLRRAIADGRAECVGRIQIKAIDGTYRMSPAYRVLKKK